MPRYIDAEKLRAEFPEPQDMRKTEGVLYHITGIWAAIDCAETEDVLKGKMLPDGTLVVNVPKESSVKRVLVLVDDSHEGGLFYADSR